MARRGPPGPELVAPRRVEATVAELEGKGVEFTSEVTDAGWGLVTTFVVPSAGTMQLYQPRYRPPFAD